jgi:integrase
MAPSAALAIPTPQLPANLEATVERAKEYGRSARSASTHRAYATDVADFHAWCTSRGLESLPATPQTLALYLTEQAEAGRKIATIRRRVAAIVDLHATAGLENPAGAKIVREIVRGIAREKGTAPRKKAALTVDGLRAALRTVDAGDLRALRDRALLLVGFHGALRRSEIAALDVADLRFEPTGVVLSIRRSKTDQEGAGAEIGLPRHPDATIDPVRALEAWIAAAAIVDGPVFRSFTMHGALQANRIDGRDVARIVQRVAKDARLEGDLGGHSLRAGFVTAAAKAGVSIDRIAQVSRHRSVPILLSYIRRANVLEDAPQLAIR